MFSKEAGQNIWYDTQKGQRGSQRKHSYKVQSEIESCVEKDRQITYDREKQNLEKDSRCGKNVTNGSLLVTYLSTSS